jgi:penicillin-binding protein 1A
VSTNGENGETRRYKTTSSNKRAKKSSKNSSTQVVRTATTKNIASEKFKKNGKKKFKYRHPRIATCIKIFFIVLMLLIIIGAGILVGTFFGLFGDDLKISEEDLVIKFENSTVYDKDGNEIASLSNGEKRKSVSLSEMSEYLPKAYVAIEDERFYSHSGVDIVRTGYATLTFILHGGNSSFGGSTITQQLIKNITNEKDNTALAGVTRKVKEMAKAIQVEHMLSKSQILELYLNTIYVGGNDINGVALGAIYYFDKDVKDLSLAECAFLAGINNTPGSYKPFLETDDTEKKEKMVNLINNRTKTVLAKMKELSYISDDEYNTAVAEVDNGLAFKKGDGAQTTVDVSYHTEAAIEQIIEQIMEEKGMTKDMAEIYVYSSGLKIYTTQDTSIQETLENEITKSQYREVTGDQTSMATMTIVDHTTGQVVACGAGTSDDLKKTKLGYYNWPTELLKQTGSSMKPIAVIAPGLESGKITAATTFYDGYTEFGNDYHPKEWYNGWKGLMSMRQAIEISANIPNIKALSIIGVDYSIKFCEKVGITNLKNEGLSLALGGLDEGVSSLQMAMAYAMIANDGVYIEPTFYTKVEDADGNVVLESNQKSERVMSEQNAFIEKSILTAPVTGASGTATYCAISGMDVAAKTGTTNNDYDRWLCGFTPYYTAATWFGYEKNSKVKSSGNPAGKIWDAVMTEIHKDLEGKRFEQPDDIVVAAICSQTGKVASDGCSNTYPEIFVKGNVPSKCEGHTTLKICTDTGLIANDYCPNVEERTYSNLPPEEKAGKWSTNYDGDYSTPSGTCSEHNSSTKKQTEAEQQQPETNTTNSNTTDTNTNTTNTTHTHEWVEDKENSKAADCEKDGYTAYKCTGCNETKKETIKALGHSYGEWTVTKEATADSEGEKQRTCSRCGNVEKQKIDKKQETTSNSTGNNVTNIPSTVSEDDLEN